MTETATQQLHDWIDAFGATLARGDIAAAQALFADGDCYWRDFVAFSWTLVTVEGREGVGRLLREQLAHAGPVTVAPKGEPRATEPYVEGWFSFETAMVRGTGHVRLKDGKAVTLLTAGQELIGHEEPARRRRIEGAHHAAWRGRRTWTDEREETARTLGRAVQPYVLIVGGGQGGLALGARLKRLGVPTLIVDALAKPGDSWRVRYKSLYLHDPIWVDHLPYLPFPDHWPVYTAKDKMGDFLEGYARIMELDIWSSTRCRNANYDEVAGRWTVEVDRDGETVVLHPRQLVLATGLSGMRSLPEIAGAETFEGLQYHSADHPGGEGMRGKRCVVIGANNSAHDIAADLWENEAAEVTMIQRSSTTVIKASSMRKIADRGWFSEDAVAAGMTTDEADLLLGALPFRFRIGMDQANCRAIQEDEADFYARLRATGFLLDFAEDETGIAGKYPRRASGYYIDVGASDLIIRGEIKVRSGVGVREIRPQSVVLTSGEELPADVIAYATGYGPMNNWAEMLISKEVADKVGQCWGLGSDTAMDPGPWEGELRNMWKPTAQPGLWFHGGNLQQSRFHSLHLALQLKALMEGVAGPVFRMATEKQSEPAE
jgi:putative flavoprotein involved in K+ transport